jgi:ubiquinone/menaquinone biosynthesis C-methylase UbiE
MLQFITQPKQILKSNFKPINDFGIDNSNNIDPEVIQSFGDEWEKFSSFDDAEIEQIGKEYFGFLSDDVINKNTYAMDVGCGTGRWTKYLASKVNFIEAVDPSRAIFFADKLLKDVNNVRLSKAPADKLPFADETFDFVMSVGVLHHIPNTQQAIIDCVKKVKKGGYFYVYLYYAFDNKSNLFKFIFKLTDKLRYIVCNFPPKTKKIACDVLAICLYMPPILLGRFFKLLGLKKLADSLPLNAYQNRTFFVIRNDSLDRFGTTFDQRFTKKEIETMLTNAGLSDIQIPDEPVHWAAIGRKL